MPRPLPMMFSRAPRRVVTRTLTQRDPGDPSKILAQFKFWLGSLEPDEMMLSAEQAQDLYAVWKQHGIASAVDDIRVSRTLAQNAVLLSLMQCDAAGQPLPPDGEERAYIPQEFAEMSVVWPDIWVDLIGMSDELIMGIPSLGNSAGAPANSSSGAPSPAASDTPPKPNGGQS